MLKGFTRNFKPLEILTEEQIEAIHGGTLDVLRQTGLRVEHERGLKLYEENGCEVDFEKKRVRFPPGLVEECIRKCPSTWHAKARNPKDDVIIGGNRVYFLSSPGMHTVDLDTWEPRVPTMKEYYDGVTVLDALPNHHIISAYTPYFGFDGVPEPMKTPESLAARIRNSTRFGLVSCPPGGETFQIKMAKAVGMELMGIPDASPPLTYYRDPIEVYFRFVEAGFPVKAAGGPIFGGNAPATYAGATITNNAEIMGGIVLAQLIKPGTRVIAGDCVCFPMNMRSGSPAFGAIGQSIHQVMFNQIWRRYGLPTIVCSAGFSSSKRIDFQCGYERSITCLLSALSGANVIMLHGSISSELTHHPIQAVLDDDIAGMVGRFLAGVEVNDETLAIELIEKVGPVPGFFLSKAHTRKWWKREQFVPKVADRLTYPEWMKTGKKSCLDYAKERTKDILATHKAIPLTDDQEHSIENILEEARNYYKDRGLISEEEMIKYRKMLESAH